MATAAALGSNASNNAFKASEEQKLEQIKHIADPYG
jgi:hypothetical protein